MDCMSTPLDKADPKWHCKPCLKKIKRQTKSDEKKQRDILGLPSPKASRKKEKKPKTSKPASKPAKKRNSKSSNKK